MIFHMKDQQPPSQKLMKVETEIVEHGQRFRVKVNGFYVLVITEAGIRRIPGGDLAGLPPDPKHPGLVNLVQ